MSLTDDIQLFTAQLPVTTKEKKGTTEFTIVIAERKAFLSKSKLEYRVKYRVNDADKILVFTEMLKETNSGLSAGDTSPGFGFKTETYNTMGKKREGTIEEQSNLFGKKYQYAFDFKTIRSKFESLARDAGYEFRYQITDKGM